MKYLLLFLPFICFGQIRSDNAGHILDSAAVGVKLGGTSITTKVKNPLRYIPPDPPGLPPGGALAAPSGFYDSDVEPTSVVLVWQNVSGNNGYEVYMDGAYHATINPNGTTYTATGLTTDTNYKFKVATIDGSSIGSFTYEIDVRLGLYPPEVPLVATGYPSATEPTNTTPYINAFGLTEQKISQRSVLGDVLTVEGDYPKMLRWNRNESYMRTQGFPGEYFDGSTYAPIANKNGNRFMSYDPNFPDDSYSGNNNTFEIKRNGTVVFTRTFNIAGGASRNYDSDKNLLQTAEAGFSYYPDSNGDYFVALEARIGTAYYCIVYNITQDVIVSERAAPNPYNGWYAMSAKGTYVTCLVQAAPSGNGLHIRNNDAGQTDVNGGGPFTPTAGVIGHADMGISMQGNEVLVGRALNRIRMWKLNPWTEVEFFGGTTRISHVSCKNLYQPGWAFVDDWKPNAYGSYSGTEQAAYRKFFAIKLDENRTGIANVLTRTYALHYANDVADADGHNEWYGVPDLSGERLSFSNWHPAPATALYKELYVCQLLE